MDRMVGGTAEPGYEAGSTPTERLYAALYWRDRGCGVGLDGVWMEG